MFNSMNEFSNDIENQDSFILFGQDMKVFFFFQILDIQKNNNQQVSNDVFTSFVIT
jgi:hypothetical protein